MLKIGLIFGQSNFFSYLCNMEFSYSTLYKKEKTFVENLHDCFKLHRYVKGKHYLEIDCGEYICICPFCYGILGRFSEFFHHCVCCNKELFDKYFDEEFLKYGNLKAFFIKKDFKLKYNNIFGFTRQNDNLWEFTCWIYVNTKRDDVKRIWYGDKYVNDYFYFFHNSNNQENQIEEIEKVKHIIIDNYTVIVNEFKNSKKYKELKKL